jgi:hypothetical protein
MELGGDLKYAREAEITHSRVAMLAAAGFLVPQIFKFREYSANALLAQQEVPVEVWSQIAIFVAVVEGLRSQIIYKPDSVPGDHGFDPLGFQQKFANSPAAMREMQLKELKNGRLAMLVGRTAAAPNACAFTRTAVAAESRNARAFTQTPAYDSLAVTGMVAQGLITGKGPLEQLF